MLTHTHTQSYVRASHNISLCNPQSWMQNNQDRNKHQPLPTRSCKYLTRTHMCLHTHTVKHTHTLNMLQHPHTIISPSTPFSPNTVNPIRAAPSTSHRTDSSWAATISCCFLYPLLLDPRHPKSPLLSTTATINSRSKSCRIQNTFSSPCSILHHLNLCLLLQKILQKQV